ncbi:MAG TPA: PqqD family protein [Pyrinomonadaceae bacterium]|jgi:hypothetical protein|nr:PqqD family protein [Pyrinomonadaceae bacterium]
MKDERAATAATSEPFEHIVATDFDGGEGVLVDLNTKQYYQLNETAMLIWRGLEAGRSVEDIVSEMMEIYDIDSDHAAESVNKLIESLRGRKILKPQ